MTVVRGWDALSAPLRAALASSTTVVTPNNRLARRLAALYDSAQSRTGCAVWPAPIVVPWNGWLERLWLDVLACGCRADPPRRITLPQAMYLWGRIVADEALSLQDEPGAAALGADAWALVHAWGAGGPSWRAWTGGDDDGAVFARWAEDYSGLLLRRNGLDAAQLPDWLAFCSPEVPAWRGGTVVFAGFVEITPQQERLLAAMAAAGTQITRASTVLDDGADAITRTCRTAGATPRDEVACALAWARDRALANPGACIGIAIDDLASRREEVRALAEEILCPALQWPGHEDAARPYNISLGTATNEVPLIAAALELIALAHAPLPISRAAALMRSPYVGAENERAERGGDAWLARAQLEADWLREGRREISLDDAIVAIGVSDRAFADRWRVAHGEQKWRASATPREWIEAWRVWLVAAGWPGERSLSSNEWQARAVWDELLAQFALLGSVAPFLRGADAVVALAALAKNTVFQPETPPAPIQILGFLEATGLPLDALWVAGLAAESWPPAPQPNPLLPWSWQRERNVPRSTASRELAYAQALTAQWACGAGEVVFSFAQRVDDHLRSISSLVSTAAWYAIGTTLPTTAHDQFARAPVRERIADDRAPPLAIGSFIAGGAGLIAAQSDCPFRALALYRLATDVWPTPIDGLSALERGSIVHAALAAFWSDVGDHATLVAFTGEALAARINVAVAAAATTIPAARWRRLPAIVRAGESTRIAQIVYAWLDGFERNRPAFAVAEVEASRRLRLGDLEMKLRLDRIDALADGGIAIVDYKTGAAVPPAKWFDVRPQAPQLGLYVLAQQSVAATPPVRAAAYAQLKTGEFRIHGVAADAAAWPGLSDPAIIRGAGLTDWASVEMRWRQSLGALAIEVRQGYAAVAPRDVVKTCQRCGLQPLCRIGTLALPAGIENRDE